MEHPHLSDAPPCTPSQSLSKPKKIPNETFCIIALHSHNVFVHSSAAGDGAGIKTRVEGGWPGLGTDRPSSVPYTPPFPHVSFTPRTRPAQGAPHSMRAPRVILSPHRTTSMRSALRATGCCRPT